MQSLSPNGSHKTFGKQAPFPQTVTRAKLPTIPAATAFRTTRSSQGKKRTGSDKSSHHSFAYCGMSTNRENIPWNATVMVSVGPLRCFATIRSASP